MLDGQQAYPPGQVLTERAADSSLDFGAIPAPVAGTNVTVRLLAGLAGKVADRAAIGIAAKDIALRALDHFDAVDVVQVGAHDCDGGLKHLVNEEAHAGRIAGLKALHTDPADSVHGHRVAPKVLDVEVGRLVGDLGNVCPAEVLDIVGIEDVH